MSFTLSLFNRSVFFLALIPLFAVWGFWVTYFTRPQDTVAIYEHVHGIGMIAWLLMLVLQPYLIRSNRRNIHRQTGKLVYVLVPWIVISTILVANLRLSQRGLTPEGLYIFSIQTFVLLQFVVCATMAMRHRKQSDVHARWMICTGLTMLDPIFARIIAINFWQVPIESGLIQLITFGFIDLVLIALLMMDWKFMQRKDVFLPALVLFAITQVPIFFVVDSTLWHAFSDWFMQLPLT